MDYDSGTYDDYAEISDEIIEEMEENSKLRSIFLFKEYISKEPEFTGIGYISSYDLLQIFQNPKKCKCKCKCKCKPKSCISNYQLDLLKDLTMTLFNKIYSDQYYDTVCDHIFAKIYI